MEGYFVSKTINVPDKIKSNDIGTYVTYHVEKHLGALGLKEVNRRTVTVRFLSARQVVIQYIQTSRPKFTAEQTVEFEG